MVGYARVSTQKQHHEAQTDALTAAGCDKLFVEHASGILARRPALDDAVARARSDMDSLIAERIDAGAIAAACRLASFDVAARNNPALYRPDAQTTPDTSTTAHIGAMVARTVDFFESQGGIMLDGFNLLGGYTNVIDTGDGDHVTPR